MWFAIIDSHELTSVTEKVVLQGPELYYLNFIPWGNNRSILLLPFIFVVGYSYTHTKKNCITFSYISKMNTRLRNIHGEPNILEVVFFIQFLWLHRCSAVLNLLFYAFMLHIISRHFFSYSFPQTLQFNFFFILTLLFYLYSTIYIFMQDNIFFKWKYSSPYPIQYKNFYFLTL